MGDIAEMMLDGILDENGEYTGYMGSYSSNSYFHKTNNNINQIDCILWDNGICRGKAHSKLQVLNDFFKKHKPEFKHKGNGSHPSKYSSACNYIHNHCLKEFKHYIKQLKKNN